MDKYIQPSLFPELEQKPFDADAYATHVATHAPMNPYESHDYDDMYSALSQQPDLDHANIFDISGADTDEHADKDLQEIEDTKLRHPSTGASVVELPRPGYDNNPHNTAEARKEANNLPKEVNEIGKVGVRAAREMLGQVRGH